MDARLASRNRLCIPAVDSASRVMWVYAPPPETSSSPPSAQRTLVRSYRLVPGVTYASMPMIGFTPAPVACFQKSYAPNTLPWLVIASAGIPIRLVSANRSVSWAAPSSTEYSVCTWRCTNASGAAGKGDYAFLHCGPDTFGARPNGAGHRACRRSGPAGATGRVPAGAVGRLPAASRRPVSADREHQHAQVDEQVVERRQQQAGRAEVEHGQAAAEHRGAEHAEHPLVAVRQAERGRAEHSQPPGGQARAQRDRHAEQHAAIERFLAPRRGDPGAAARPSAPR